MTSGAGHVAIGRVIRPQGRRGEVLAEPLSDRPERFPTLRRVLLVGAAGSEERAVTACWPHKGRYVLKLEGVDSIDAAERLRGRELAIEASQLPPLPAGSYYHHELVGLRALDPEGRELGRVAGVLETGAVPVLEIASADGELLVPLASAFVLAVEPARGTLTVRPPDGERAH